MSSVDIVIPCYNYARFLPHCVQSVLGQEGVDVRILIIDDCSADDSEAVGLRLAAQDRCVEFRRHPKNRGHIATYNEGLLEWASADYSVLLSADDALAPGALARAVGIMDQHPDTGMVCGLGRFVYGEEISPIIAETSSADFRIVPGSKFLERCFLMGNVVCTPTAVVRTALQQRLGGYRADLPHSGDMEMWMRFAVHAPVGVLNTVQAYYRKHSRNMSRHYDSQQLGDKREVIQACEQILGQWGAHFPAACYWREMMHQRISRECCWLASCAFDNGDIKGYQACIDFAAQVYRGIRTSRMWWKTRVKGIVGQTVWKTLWYSRARFRELCRIYPGQQIPVSAPSDQITGRWPDVLN